MDRMKFPPSPRPVLYQSDVGKDPLKLRKDAFRNLTQP